MSTGFEKIASDSNLQDHWIRRLIAFIIDSIIAWIATTIIMGVVFLPLIVLAAITDLPWFVFNPFTFPFFAGILSVLYFALLEFWYGWTFGKRIMSLRTIETNGQKPSFDRALIRNISKIYWILALIDVIIGLATLGDPHQKIADRFAGTTVTSKTVSPSASTPHPPPPPT